MEDKDSSNIISKLVWILWIIQIFLAISAFLFTLDVVVINADVDTVAVYFIATILSYLALIAIGYGLFLIIYFKSI